MATASPAAPDLKAVAASYNDGLRWLVLCVVTDPSLQAESSVTQFRQKMASLNDQVKDIRSRSAEIQKVKEEFERLLKELKMRNADVRVAKSKLDAFSQEVGEAAFRECLAGRLTEFPALQTRRNIQQQIDALSQDKVQVDQAAHTGFAGKVKAVAHSTALSGRILLQKQKVASADRSLGSAVLETQQDEQVLATGAIDVLSNVREARKAIADCEENHTLTKRQLDDCRLHAVTLGIDEADSSHFDGEYKKCVERLLDLECKKLSARWEFGQSLLSSPPEPLPEHLRNLAVEMSRIASEHPEACRKSTVDKATLIADLKEQVSLLHEEAGEVIFEKGLFKDTLSEEFNKVAAASEQGRTSELRQLGKAGFAKQNEMMDLNEFTRTVSSELNAIELTIKELRGKALVGTDGKAPPNTGKVARAVASALSSLIATATYKRLPPSLPSTSVAPAVPCQAAELAVPDETPTVTPHVPMAASEELSLPATATSDPQIDAQHCHELKSNGWTTAMSDLQLAAHQSLCLGRDEVPAGPLSEKSTTAASEPTQSPGHRFRNQSQPRRKNTAASELKRSLGQPETRTHWNDAPKAPRTNIVQETPYQLNANHELARQEELVKRRREEEEQAKVRDRELSCKAEAVGESDAEAKRRSERVIKILKVAGNGALFVGKGAVAVAVIGAGAVVLGVAAVAAVAVAAATAGSSGAGSTKTCSRCGMAVPMAATQCPYCGNNENSIGTRWKNGDSCA